jgi:hypothetical protein
VSLEVFLSYSVGPSDLQLVANLQEQVNAAGVALYLADRDVQPGTNLSAKIEKAISRSEAVVALLTEKGVDSNWVNQEIGFALGKEKVVVPLVEEGVKVPGMLVGREYISFHRDRFAEALERVRLYLESLKSKVSERLQQAIEAIAVVVLAIFVVVLLILVALTVLK